MNETNVFWKNEFSFFGYRGTFVMVFTTILFPDKKEKTDSCIFLQKFVLCCAGVKKII